MRETLVYIAGSGRSGSTLLDLLLNRNSLIHGVGEFFRLTQHSRDNQEPCTCGKPILECPFWLEVQKEIQRELGDDSDPELLKSFEIDHFKRDQQSWETFLQQTSLILGHRWLHSTMSRYLLPRTSNAVKNSLVTYRAIRKVTKCPVILESTKNPRRMKELYLATPDFFKLIHLVRDGRAVAASSMRRVGMDMRSAAADWEMWNRRSLWAQKTIPDDLKLNIRYEEVCLSTEETLMKICEFIGIPYEASMMELRKEESHSLGGNPMRFRLEESTIRLDEQWRDQLTEEDLKVFESVAGKMNRKFGYTD